MGRPAASRQPPAASRALRFRAMSVRSCLSAMGACSA